MAGGFRGFGKSQLQQTVELARDTIREFEKSLAKLRADNLRLEQRCHRVEEQLLKIVTITKEGRQSALRERVGSVLDEIVRRVEKVAGRRFTRAEDKHVRDAVQERPLTPAEQAELLQAQEAQRRRDRVQRGSSWDLQRKARDVTRGKDDDLGPSR